MREEQESELGLRGLKFRRERESQREERQREGERGKRRRVEGERTGEKSVGGVQGRVRSGASASAHVHLCL